MELTGTFVSTLADLREVLANTDKLVIVYFYTEWSPACRRIRFEFMQAELRNPDAIYLAANMDKAKAMAAKLDITLDNIPAIVVFKNGRQLYTATLISAQAFNKMDYPVPEDDVLSVTSDTEASRPEFFKT